MKLTTIFMLFAGALAACATPAEPTERFHAEAEGFSVDLPVAWKAQRDRGAVVFTAPASPRRTIAVRTVPRPVGMKARKALAATRTVISSMPDAKVIDERALSGELVGAAFELTFTPPGANRKYSRTHVVLVGETHIFHVVETSPAAERINDELLENAVASLREEV